MSQRLKKSQTARRDSAFTLTELVTVLILSAATSLIVPRLFRSAMLTIQDSAATTESFNATDSMIAALRADVWSSRDLRVMPASIEITGAENHSVSWSMMPSAGDKKIATILRRANGEGRRWIIGTPAKFIGVSSGLRVEIGESSDAISLPRAIKLFPNEKVRS